MVCSSERALATRRADPEAANARGAAWREANPEKVKANDAIARARYREDPAKSIAAARAWQKANPEKVRISSAAARAARGRRLPPLSPEEVQESKEWVKILLKDPCSYCGGPSECIDHIVPVARGGTGTWDNLTAACTSCNSSKGAKSLLMFLFDRTLNSEGVSVLPYTVGV